MYSSCSQADRWPLFIVFSPSPYAPRRALDAGDFSPFPHEVPWRLRFRAVPFLRQNAAETPTAASGGELPRYPKPSPAAPAQPAWFPERLRGRQYDPPRRSPPPPRCLPPSRTEISATECSRGLGWLQCG